MRQMSRDGGAAVVFGPDDYESSHRRQLERAGNFCDLPFNHRTCTDCRIAGLPIVAPDGSNFKNINRRIIEDFDLYYSRRKIIMLYIRAGEVLECVKPPRRLSS